MAPRKLWLGALIASMIGVILLGGVAYADALYPRYAPGQPTAGVWGWGNNIPDASRVRWAVYSIWDQFDKDWMHYLWWNDPDFLPRLEYESYDPGRTQYCDQLDVPGDFSWHDYPFEPPFYQENQCGSGSYREEFKAYFNGGNVQAYTWYGSDLDMTKITAGSGGEVNLSYQDYDWLDDLNLGKYMYNSNFDAYCANPAGIDYFGLPGCG